MMLPPVPLVAALFDFSVSPHMIAILMPIAAMIFAGVIVICAMYFQHQRRQLWHETARLALEKGQPLPPDAEDFNFRDRRWNRSLPDGRCDLRRGFILIAVGAGLFFFLGGISGAQVARVGAIPGFIGIALILFSVFGGSRPSAPQPRPDDRAPRT